MFFFISAPIFLHRTGIHLSLSGHWLILLTFYIELTKVKSKTFLRGANLILSSLIFFYFTMMIIILNFLTYLFLLIKKKSLFKNIIKEIALIYPLLFIAMYCTGYFVIRPEDGLGGGYGFYNLNLNSFFNPSGFAGSNTFNWSIIMPKLSFNNGEHEGFAYLGLGGFFILLFAILSFFIKKGEFFISKKEILSILSVFSLLAISQNINFGQFNILFIDLNNYILAILSTIRSSGRLIWPIYYLTFILGIFFIFNFFSGKKKFIILIVLLLIQLIDLSSGLKNYYKGNSYNYTLKNTYEKEFWINLSSNINTLRSVQFTNKSDLYYDLRTIFLNYNFSKTDIVYLARHNRKNIPLNNYRVIESFLDKDLDIFNETAFLTKDLNIVRNIHFLYGENLHYYFRNNIWIITTKFITKPKNIDFIQNSLKIDKIFSNKKINFNQTENLNYGFGWSKVSSGLASDGIYSSIIFTLDSNNCSKNFYLKLNIENYFNNISGDFDIYFNKKTLSKNNLNLIPLDINCENIKNYHTLEFKYKDPISLRELDRGLNHSKRSIILKEIEIIN